MDVGNMKTGCGVVWTLLSLLGRRVEEIQAVLRKSADVRGIAREVHGVPVRHTNHDFAALAHNTPEFFHRFDSVGQMFQHVNHLDKSILVGRQIPRELCDVADHIHARKRGNIKVDEILTDVVPTADVNFRQVSNIAVHGIAEK